MIDLLGYGVSTAVTWVVLLYLPFALSVWLVDKYISRHLKGVFEPKALKNILRWMSRDYHYTAEPAGHFIVSAILSMVFIVILSCLSLIESDMKGDTLGYWGNVIDNINSLSLGMASFWLGVFLGLLLVGGIHFIFKKIVEIRKQTTDDAQEISKLRSIVLDVVNTQNMNNNYVMTGIQLDALRAYMVAFEEMRGRDSPELNEKFNSKREQLFVRKVIPRD